MDSHARRGLAAIGITLLVTAIWFAALLSSGCVNPIAPMRHSFTCYTQPRLYTLPTGVLQWETDSYDQGTPCPSIRIE